MMMVAYNIMMMGVAWLAFCCAIYIEEDKQTDIYLARHINTIFLFFVIALHDTTCKQCSLYIILKTFEYTIVGSYF